MSIQSVLTRIEQLETAFTPPAPPTTTTQAAGASPTSFSSLLQQAGGTAGAGAAAATGGVTPVSGSVGQRMVQIAQGEVGQGEQPPGSNDGPRLGVYRSATQGAMAGAPWCCYFASWVARQAGVPVGPNGQGFGAVDDLWAWGQQTGRALKPGQSPQPGDLAIYNEHIGIVEKVLPNGDFEAIEGNYSNKVSRVHRSPSEAIGFVRLG